MDSQATSTTLPLECYRVPQSLDKSCFGDILLPGATRALHLGHLRGVRIVAITRADQSNLLQIPFFDHEQAIPAELTKEAEQDAEWATWAEEARQARLAEEAAEYDRRVRLTREAQQAARVDLLHLSEPSEVKSQEDSD